MKNMIQLEGEVEISVCRSATAIAYILVICLFFSVMILDSSLCEDYYRQSDGLFVRTKSGLTQIPGDIPSSARTVHLSRNKLTKLNVNVFAHLSRCTLLQVNNNSIAEIESGAFNGLVSLRWLNLEHNKLVELEASMFKGLPSKSLETLYLGYNEISIIEGVCCSNGAFVEKSAR